MLDELVFISKQISELAAKNAEIEQRVEAMRLCCELLANRQVPKCIRDSWSDDFAKGYDYACQVIAEDIASTRADAITVITQNAESPAPAQPSNQ